MANDEKALDSYFSAFFDDDDGDDEYLPIEDWKQVLERARGGGREQGVEGESKGWRERARGGGRITVAFVVHALLLLGLSLASFPGTHSLDL